ncbi:hypothetical protein [Chondromyces crocatus]|uniref:Uncharacterized protein n=1 Tax=Chondromyces crocatus TaxID=52 RepID=A0A0K1EMB0_CHOCO|nr:hypothetical protein [Chondromyces crocatus]AKT41787.1 uncharacterized protein CMC5_059980 [Chondromyces crocatus]
MREEGQVFLSHQLGNLQSFAAENPALRSKLQPPRAQEQVPLPCANEIAEWRSLRAVQARFGPQVCSRIASSEEN